VPQTDVVVLHMPPNKLPVTQLPVTHLSAEAAMRDAMADLVTDDDASPDMPAPGDSKKPAQVLPAIKQMQAALTASEPMTAPETHAKPQPAHALATPARTAKVLATHAPSTAIVKAAKVTKARHTKAHRLQVKAAPKVQAAKVNKARHTKAHRLQVKAAPKHVNHLKVEKNTAKVAATATQKNVQPKSKAVTAPLRKVVRAMVSSHTVQSQPISTSEKQLQDMQNILNSNDEMLRSDFMTEMDAAATVGEEKATAVVKAVVKATAVHKKATAVKAIAVHKTPPAPRNLRHTPKALTRPSKVALKPPRAVAGYPLVHRAAKKPTRAVAPKPASIPASQVSSRKAMPLKKDVHSPQKAVAQKVNSDSLDTAQELEQMNDLLSFDDTAPPTKALKAQPKKVVKALAVKPQKDADSVVAESDALESLINNEETKLNSNAITSPTGIEAPLNIADMDDIADMGVVNFDSQANSAVVIQDSRQAVADFLVPTQSVVPPMTQPAALAKQPSLHAKVQAELDDAEMDVASVEQELLPAAPAAALTQAAARPAVKNEEELSLVSQSNLGSQSDSLADLAGVIPNVETEALQLYNTFGGSPDALESVGGGLTFLQQQQRHTPGIPSQADLNVAWDELSSVAVKAQSALSMVQESKSPAETVAASTNALGLLQEKGDSGLDIEEECNWLMSNYEARQQVRAQEEDLLKEAHQLLGNAHVYIPHHHGHHKKKKARKLRGPQ